jgi:hypothetical protein
MQDETRGDHWPVESSPVEGNEYRVIPKRVVDIGEHAGFFMEITEEMLLHMELIAREVSKADQKDMRPGAAVKPCRFRVKEEDVLMVD